MPSSSSLGSRVDAPRSASRSPRAPPDEELDHFLDHHERERDAGADPPLREGEVDHREDALQESDLGHQDDGEESQAVPAQLRRAGAARLKIAPGRAQQAGRQVEQRTRSRASSRATASWFPLRSVGDEGSHRRDESLDAQDPVRRREDRAPTGRGDRSTGLCRVVEPERDGDRDVDDHVEPQDLQRVERDPPAMAKMPAPMKIAM